MRDNSLQKVLDIKIPQHIKIQEYSTIHIRLVLQSQLTYLLPPGTVSLPFAHIPTHTA